MSFLIAGHSSARTKLTNCVGRGADGLEHPLVLVRLDREVAYCCAAGRYEEAMKHPEECIEVGFPLGDVKMKEAAN